MDLPCIAFGVLCNELFGPYHPYDCLCSRNAGNPRVHLLDAIRPRVFEQRSVPHQACGMSVLPSGVGVGVDVGVGDCVRGTIVRVDNHREVQVYEGMGHIQMEPLPVKLLFEHVTDIGEFGDVGD